MLWQLVSARLPSVPAASERNSHVLPPTVCASPCTQPDTIRYDLAVHPARRPTNPACRPAHPARRPTVQVVTHHTPHTSTPRTAHRTSPHRAPRTAHRAPRTALRSEPYRLFNLDVFEYELDHPMTVYGSVPFLHAHGGPDGGSYGALWLNPSEAFVDLGCPESHAGGGAAGVCTHWFSASGAIDAYIFAGVAPRDVSAQHAALTGVMPLPPLFALGYHQCRWNYKDEEDVAKVHARFDEVAIKRLLMPGRRHLLPPAAHRPPPATCRPPPASHRPLPTAYDLPCRRSAWPPLRRGGAGEAREGMVSSGRDGCACSPAACAHTQSPEAAREVALEITREIKRRFLRGTRPGHRAPRPQPRRPSSPSSSPPPHAAVPTPPPRTVLPAGRDGVRPRAPLFTTLCPAIYHPVPRYLPPCAPPSTTLCPAIYHPVPRYLPPPLSITLCLAIYHPVPRFLPRHAPLSTTPGRGGVRHLECAE